MSEGETSSSALELRGVSKRFDQRVILDGIDLAVARGEMLVLVGPSGSGKSTLLKMVAGIERPDSGRVLLAGRDCTDLPPHRRAVHTVFQNYALFPHLDVTGNVAFPLRVAGVSRGECERSGHDRPRLGKARPARPAARGQLVRRRAAASCVGQSPGRFARVRAA